MPGRKGNGKGGKRKPKRKTRRLRRLGGLMPAPPERSTEVNDADGD